MGLETLLGEVGVECDRLGGVMLARRTGKSGFQERAYRLYFSKHEYPFDSVTSVWNLEPPRCANET